MKLSRPRYVFVLGGGYSGLGKGLVAASIGRLVENFGYSISQVKVDPYFNFGAGDQNPTEHGEVFVTEDGGEIDQDFGHYERITAQPTKAGYNITSGKVFASVLDKGQSGEYLGKTIQLIPHVRDEVKRQIRSAADGSDICIVELGGTIGDDEALIHLRAIHSMIHEDEEDATVVLLVPLVFNEQVGEPKTKIAQTTARQLGEIGLHADFLMCRVETEEHLDPKRRRKLSTFCNVNNEDIIADPDVDDVYHLPFKLAEQDMGRKVLDKLTLPAEEHDWNSYRDFVEALDSAKLNGRVKIAYVGKYVEDGGGIHKDSYISVEEAITRAAVELGVYPEIHRLEATAFERGTIDINKLKEYDGVIVPGGYGARGFEGKIKVIEYLRKNNVPYLGLCLGLQMAVIEYARNVCGIENAHSDESDEEGYCADPDKHVVTILSDQENKRQDSGYFGTQRLGDFVCVVDKNSKVADMYRRFNKPTKKDMKKIEKMIQNEPYRVGVLKDNDYYVIERHRHRREVNPDIVETLKENGMSIPGFHRTKEGVTLVEIIGLEDHPFFYASQFHPEFTSNYDSPNPLFHGFMEASLKARGKGQTAKAMVEEEVSEKM